MSDDLFGECITDGKLDLTKVFDRRAKRRRYYGKPCEVCGLVIGTLVSYGGIEATIKASHTKGMIVCTHCSKLMREAPRTIKLSEKIAYARKRREYLNIKARVLKPIRTRTCKCGCGKSFEDTFGRRKYFSDACRSRDRRKVGYRDVSGFSDADYQALTMSLKKKRNKPK